MASRWMKAVSIWLIAALLCSLGGAWLPGIAGAAPVSQGLEEPEIGARAAIVVEYPSGRILYEKAARERMAPASLTKIVTAILALEYGNLEDTVLVMPEDLVGESSMGLKVGEGQTLRDLLYGVMLPSGNDAAMAIGRALGGKAVSANPALTDPMAKFAEMMNARTAQLGITDSHFVNPHGLDAPNHYSTAYDLASFSWYALHFPAFNEIVKQVGYEAPGHPLLNTNEMLTRYSGADGVKTGWTDGCGLCLVTSATRDGHRLLSVVLNAPQWWGDSTAILDYSFAKLTAVPQDSSAPILGVSARGTAQWLLSSETPQPPQAGAGAGQGGGSVIEPVVQQPVSVAPAPPSSGDMPLAQGGASSALLLAPRETSWGTLWVLVLFALVGLPLLYMLASKLFRFRLTTLPAGGRSFALSPTRPIKSTSRPQRETSPRSITAARTLGRPEIARRREPSLLATAEEQRELHIERAVALASEGRQGSSMAEFLIAVRFDESLEVIEVAERYMMSANAFLALHRAQYAAGRPEAAYRTLLHASLVIPEDRTLRLALSRWTIDEYVRREA